MQHTLLLALQSEPSRERDGHDASRVLQWPSGSSAALVAILVKWIARKPEAGGLRLTSERNACKALLKRLLRVACEGGSLAFDLVTNLDLKIQDEMEGTGAVTVRVDADGELDTQELIAEVI